MSNTNKILLALLVIVIVVLIFNWKKWFGNKNGTTTNGTGTGTTTPRTTTGSRVSNTISDDQLRSTIMSRLSASNVRRESGSTQTLINRLYSLSTTQLLTIYNNPNVDRFIVKCDTGTGFVYNWFSCPEGTSQVG